MSVQHWFGFWLEMTASRGPSGSLLPSAMNSAHWRRGVCKKAFWIRLLEVKKSVSSEIHT